MQMMLITGDHDLAIGARMSGMLTKEVNATQNAQSAWEDAIRMKDLALITVTDDVAGALTKEVDMFHQPHSMPLVVVLPLNEMRRRHG